MKKRMILASALLLFTAACGAQTSAPQPADTGKTETAEPASQPAETSSPERTADDQHLEDLLNANRADTVLKRHRSMTVSRTISSLDKNIGSEYWFADQDRIFHDTSTHEAVYLTADEYILTLPEEPGSTIGVLANPAETYKEWFDASMADLVCVLMEGESVSSKEEHDGHLYITTTTSDNASKQLVFDYFAGTYGGPQYQEGLEAICNFDFDSESSDLLSIENYFADADGNKVLAVRDDYIYDADFAPDLENSVLADWIKGNKPRKIEVTFNSGTDQAFTKEYMVPKNTLFTVFCNDNYVEQFYLDEACTQPIEKTDRVSDISVFVK